MLLRRTFGSLMGAAACVGGEAASSASAPTLDVGAADRAVLAQGVSSGKTNPILHGEIVAINDYAARHGNQGWADGILYTTGEPCPMCMSAIVWAGLGGVVYGSSISALAEAGIAQIMIDSSAVRDAASFYRGRIMGGILRAETDALFRNRRRV